MGRRPLRRAPIICGIPQGHPYLWHVTRRFNYRRGRGNIAHLVRCRGCVEASRSVRRRALRIHRSLSDRDAWHAAGPSENLVIRPSLISSATWVSSVVARRPAERAIAASGSSTNESRASTAVGTLWRNALMTSLSTNLASGIRSAGSSLTRRSEERRVGQACTPRQPSIPQGTERQEPGGR